MYICSHAYKYLKVGVLMDICTYLNMYTCIISYGPSGRGTPEGEHCGNAVLARFAGTSGMSAGRVHLDCLPRACVRNVRRSSTLWISGRLSGELWSTVRLGLRFNAIAGYLHMLNMYKCIYVYIVIPGRGFGALSRHSIRRFDSPAAGVDPVGSAPKARAIGSRHSRGGAVWECWSGALLGHI